MSQLYDDQNNQFCYEQTNQPRNEQNIITNQCTMNKLIKFGTNLASNKQINLDINQRELQVRNTRSDQVWKQSHKQQANRLRDEPKRITRAQYTK